MLGSAIQISDSSIIINVSDHVGSFFGGYLRSNVSPQVKPDSFFLHYVICM